MRAALLVGLLFVTTVAAWDWDAHRWLAGRVCLEYACGACLEDIKEGAVAPDRDFKDFTKHLYYNTSLTCPPGEWTCPTSDNPIALEKTAEWLERAKNDSGCERYYDIGVASHYFFDSKNFFHRVQKEDYEGCHAPLETRVGDKIGKGAFTVTQCNVTVTDADFVPWLAEFRGAVDEAVFGRSANNSSLVPAGSTAITEKPFLQRELPQIALFALFLLVGLGIVKRFRKRLF